MPRHLLGIRELSKEQLIALLDNGLHFAEVGARDIKKVPALRGKTIINLFLEASTRTRVSFEIAGKWLSADTINVGSDSSVKKGETLLDTARNLEAMNPDILVVRHGESGAPHMLARYLQRCSVINAGDGMHEHPTQALLDCITLRAHLKKQGRELSGLKIAIVGDVRHSRVARSNILAHQLLGNSVHLVGPPTLVPHEFAHSDAYGSSVKVFHSLADGIRDVDVVMCLRLQSERQAQNFLPSLEEYTREYGINEKRLRAYAPNSVVLHPGPINRGIEVSSEVVDGPRSLVADQVNYGVAARMAVLFSVSTGGQVIE
jgi:aspartate carbamoyltransferase catalytic subunit